MIEHLRETLEILVKNIEEVAEMKLIIKRMIYHVLYPDSNDWYDNMQELVKYLSD